ncbi:MAG: glycosyltransferase [Dehalococcoidia bacterium]|nr:MAG: glycosyltransferase [Dehalococcoidia bacterium]
MRVLHVIPNLAARTGGPPVAVIESARALVRIGVESTIVATDMAEAASARSHGRASIVDLPEGADELDVRLLPARWPRRLAFSPELRRALADEAPRCDVVHIHSLFLFPQFAAWRAARRSGVPYVVSPRGALDPHLRRRSRAVKAIGDALWQRSMLEGASVLHATSDEEARLLADVAPAVPRAVVPNGIDCAAYEALPPASEFRERFLGGASGPVVMFLGRLSHKKGLDVLVRAFARVRRELPDAQLAIVGPDDEGLASSLRAIAGREGVADAATFTGMLRGRDKLSALAAADVWALPSHTENFGIAVAEALAARRAVVVSPGVNIAPEIAAAGAGVVAELDAEAFAGAIAGLVRDDARRVELGCAGREFARRYDWSAVAPQLAAMYEVAAARGASPPVSLRAA